MPGAILAAKSLTKTFGRVRALENVSLDFLAGEIHGIVGENGAGKSTLMRLLSGELAPDSGSVELAEGCRAAMVHQHFMLVPAFTVAENLAFASPHRTALVDPDRDCAAAIEVGHRLGWALNPNAKAASLSVGEKQRIEIIRALALDPEILILDEPTAVLAPSEVGQLLEILQKLKEDGKTVLLIAHKLDEVLAIADRVSVLRGGKLAGSFMAASVDAATLATTMLGEASDAVRQSPKAVADELAVDIEHIAVIGPEGNLAVSGISETIRRGEILGIGGVDGNGQVELAEAVAGIRPHTGAVTIAGSRGIAYIPQDRQRDGLALAMSVFDNFAIEGHRRFKRGAFLSLKGLRDWAKSLVKKFRIKSPTLDTPVRSLSGGNQQKIVVGRSLDASPTLIVAVNPTRGLDVRASNDVLEAIREQAASGSAVLLISTDRDELAALADRTKYLGRGRLYGDFESALVGGRN